MSGTIHKRSGGTLPMESIYGRRALPEDVSVFWERVLESYDSGNRDMTEFVFADYGVSAEDALSLFQDNRVSRSAPRAFYADGMGDVPSAIRTVSGQPVSLLLDMSALDKALSSSVSNEEMVLECISDLKFSQSTSVWDACDQLDRWISERCDYDDSLSAHGMADCFGGSAVCSGYALAYQAVLETVGVPCGYVTGTAGPGNASHAWCAVWLDGGYYYVDPTWNDSEGLRGWLMASAEEMADDHWTDWDTDWCGAEIL